MLQSHSLTQIKATISMGDNILALIGQAEPTDNKRLLLLRYISSHITPQDIGSAGRCLGHPLLQPTSQSL